MPSGHARLPSDGHGAGPEEHRGPHGGEHSEGKAGRCPASIRLPAARVCLMNRPWVTRSFTKVRIPRLKRPSAAFRGPIGAVQPHSRFTRHALASNVALRPGPRVGEGCNLWPGYSVILGTPGGRIPFSRDPSFIFLIPAGGFPFSLLLQARTSGPRVGEGCNP